jgi:hypothetical protein
MCGALALSHRNPAQEWVLLRVREGRFIAMLYQGNRTIETLQDPDDSGPLCGTMPEMQAAVAKVEAAWAAGRALMEGQR